MKTGFYPGCSMHGSSREYHESLFALTNAFGIKLHEVPDWNCCGATAAHNLDRDLAKLLPARILALAESNQMEELLVPCAACYNRLVMVQHELRQNEQHKEQVARALGLPFANTIRILNILQFIGEYISPRLPESVKIPLNFPVACYYGCLLVRPQKILNSNRFEDPVEMDEIMVKLGSAPVDWPFKTECCGAGLSISNTEMVAKLSGKIIKDATDRGAKAIIVACPMCHSNLDMRRRDIESYWKQKFEIPVLYITQAIAMAVGIKPLLAGTHRHFVPVRLAV